MTSLDLLIEKILDREGGVADVGDGKGVTRYGQTPAWLAEFHLPVPSGRAQAAANYKTWLSLVGLTDVISPGDNLADILFDIGVMSTALKAIKALQAALKIPVDGILGPTTQRMLALADRRRLAFEVIAWDMTYQGRVITNNPQRAMYAEGWATRMADHVRRLA